jgi:hypothetical protein
MLVKSNNGEMTMSNLPKLSKRARAALDLLADGGQMVERLERDRYTGREQFHTRFMMKGSVVRGLGIKTKFELQDAGFRFVTANSTSVSTYYKLSATA